VSECVDPKRHIRLYSRVHVGLRWNTDNTLTKHKLEKKQTTQNTAKQNYTPV